MNVFAQVSYVEFEYYWFCVFLNDPLCKFWYEEKKNAMYSWLKEMKWLFWIILLYEI